jgi:hypothetical protein
MVPSVAFELFGSMVKCAADSTVPRLGPRSSGSEDCMNHIEQLGGHRVLSEKNRAVSARPLVIDPDFERKRHEIATAAD